jgi:hypothetical protein
MWKTGEGSAASRNPAETLSFRAEILGEPGRIQAKLRVRSSEPRGAIVASAPNIQRGVTRALIDADQAVLSELPLANGRRANLAAVDHAGRITVVEIKSCRPDFMCDRKWQDYLGYCDRFYFAVDSRPAATLIPTESTS